MENFDVTTITELPAASKSPVPPSASALCDDAACAFERLTILTDTIIEALRTANDDMSAGDVKDRALYEVHSLMTLLREDMTRHDTALERIRTSIVTERKAA
jgi:hypothetical protein